MTRKEAIEDILRMAYELGATPGEAIEALTRIPGYEDIDLTGTVHEIWYQGQEPPALTDIKTDTYRCHDGFYFDIVDNNLHGVVTGERYSAYIYREDCGVKSLMFSTGHDVSKEEFYEMVITNLDVHKKLYMENVVDVDDIDDVIDDTDLN